jgi:hypothetical protein
MLGEHCPSLFCHRLWTLTKYGLIMIGRSISTFQASPAYLRSAAAAPVRRSSGSFGPEDEFHFFHNEAIVVARSDDYQPYLTPLFEYLYGS